MYIYIYIYAYAYVYTHVYVYIYIYICLRCSKRNSISSSTGTSPAAAPTSAAMKLFSLLSTMFQTQSGFKRVGVRELKPDCVRKRAESNEKSC